MKQTLTERLKIIEAALGSQFFLNLLYGWINGEIEARNPSSKRSVKALMLAFVESQERKLTATTAAGQTDHAPDLSAGALPYDKPNSCRGQCQHVGLSQSSRDTATETE